MIEMTDKQLPKSQSISIDDSAEQQRLDNFLIKVCKGVPKSRIYRAIRGGEVRVNKSRVGADYRLKIGDLLRIPPFRRSESRSKVEISKASRRLQALESEIMYEDQDIIVLNKPAGIAVHGGSGIVLGVIETLRLLRPQSKILELAHRLDRETSGCLLVSKKASINKEIQEQFKKKTVKKKYLMLVHGSCEFEQRKVALPLLRDQLSSGERIVRVNSSGKEALTEFKVIKRFRAATLLEARPSTGRTHQLRVHAQAIGHPIVGDPKYGDRELDKQLKGPAKQRLYLHAASLSIHDPRTHQRKTFCATLEPSFVQQLQYLKN